MNTAPAVGFLQKEVREDGLPMWFVRTERQSIPLKGTHGMISSVEALEYAMRQGWSFLFRNSSQLYVTQNVELLTLTFVKGVDGWAAYPAYLAKEEGMDLSPNTTPEQITSVCIDKYWYPMGGDRLVFQKLGLPSSEKE